jgi:hypothetical protein
MNELEMVAFGLSLYAIFTPFALDFLELSERVWRRGHRGMSES